VDPHEKQSEERITSASQYRIKELFPKGIPIAEKVMHVFCSIKKLVKINQYFSDFLKDYFEPLSSILSVP